MKQSQKEQTMITEKNRHLISHDERGKRPRLGGESRGIVMSVTVPPADVKYLEKINSNRSLATRIIINFHRENHK